MPNSRARRRSGRIVMRRSRSGPASLADIRLAWRCAHADFERGP